MRLLIFLMAIGFVTRLSALDPQSLKSFGMIPPSAKLHFVNLCLGQYPSLFADNGKGFEVLATTPGLTSALIELADRLETEQEWDGFSRVWGLLGQRTDATEPEQDYVYARLDEVFDRSAGPKSAIKEGGLRFLGSYPSEKHEKLLIKYLADSDGAKKPVPYEGAAESLGRIGTELSIAPLRAYLKRATPPEGGKWREHEIAIASLGQINARIRAAPSSAGSQPVETKPSGIPGESATARTTPEHGDQASSTWQIGTLVIFTAGVLILTLVLVLRGRKGSK